MLRRLKTIVIRIISDIRLLAKINIGKTLYFNLHYFPFKTAMHMPFYIYRRSVLKIAKGKIVINSPIKSGMVRFGQQLLGTQDPYYTRTIWEVTGNLIINGYACIGRGSKITIDKNATLFLGKKFVSTGNLHIICKKNISFGDNCLLSWDILMMDTDFHNIKDEGGIIINPPESIRIGNNVWIGCRNTILKGVNISDNNVIAASSTITRSFNEKNCIIGGHGKSAEVLKRKIEWEH